jgi:hypothetical protein
MPLCLFLRNAPATCPLIAAAATQNSLAAVFIGRLWPFGNKFGLGPGGMRLKCGAYKAYMTNQPQNPSLYSIFQRSFTRPAREFLRFTLAPIQDPKQATISILTAQRAVTPPSRQDAVKAGKVSHTLPHDQAIHQHG